MKNNRILLYGASGHSKVIRSIFESLDLVVAGIFDDDKNIWLDNCTVIHGYESKYEPELPILISIGDNKIRKIITQMVSHSFSTAIHPSSIIDDKSKVGFGTAIFHGVTIQRDTFIGNHCIINTNACVDHDCVIEDFVHIAPSATLCGNVKVGEGTIIGANATVLPNKIVGKWCIIGAGSVIIDDLPDHSIVVGVPGRIIKTVEND